MEDCQVCATEMCADERADCLEDDVCSALLGCRGMCDNPPCLRGCDADHGLSPWFDELDGCVWTRCSARCGSGDNFACTGVYAPPPVEQERFQVELWFDQVISSLTTRNDLNFLAGADVRACASASADCDGQQDRAQVEADDRVTLTVERELLGGFDGYFEVEQPEFGSFGARELLYFPPTSTSAIHRVRFVPLEFLPQLKGLHAPDPDLPELDPDLARIVVYPRDCTGQVATSKVCFELDGEEATVVYNAHPPPTLNTIPPPTTECAAFENIATIGNLAEGSYRVRGSIGGLDTHDRYSILARPGWSTHVYLDPVPR